MEKVAAQKEKQPPEKDKHTIEKQKRVKENITNHLLFVANPKKKKCQRLCLMDLLLNLN